MVYAAWDDRFPVGVRNGRGQYVDVMHEDGWTSRQIHLSEIFVTVGELVQQGRWLGLSGATGLTGVPPLYDGPPQPHSHDAVFDADGVAVDWMTLVKPA